MMTLISLSMLADARHILHFDSELSIDCELCNHNHKYKYVFLVSKGLHRALVTVSPVRL